MAGPNPVNPNPVGPKAYETNLQHVGGQRQAAPRKTEDPASESPAHDRVDLTAGDHVTQAREGAENAAHVGGVQQHAREEGAEPLLLPAPKDEASPPPPEGGGPGTALVPYEEHLPAVVEKPGLPATRPQGEVIDAQWEPVYPGTVEQGLSPYVPAGGNGGSGAPPPGGPPPGGPANPGMPPPGASQTEQAQNYARFQQEQQEIQKIYMQMAADRQKWMAEMWKIIQDTQAKMYEIMQSAILYRAQVHDKINQMWDAVIRGGP